ncbi:MAG: response regulator transcription factor [Chloroflexota bacterium]|nr:response regulator transcription factor [Chloroflexota bacterium]
MEPIRILLADDHIMVREGTKRILEREPDLEIVAQADDGREAVELVRSTEPDLAIIDISMPVMNGIEATKEIKRIAPKTAILILTAYDDDEYVFAILEAGAAGYLLKNARGSELIEAVRSVHAGDSVLHPAIAKKVLYKMRHGKTTKEKSPADLLTDRELEVLRHAAQGSSNREIAEALVISPRTVQSHMANIFDKLQVGSRTEAVIVALRQDIVSLDDIPAP